MSQPQGHGTVRRNVTEKSSDTTGNRSWDRPVKISTRNIPGGKGGRCVRLTTSPPSCAECHENLGA